MRARAVVLYSARMSPPSRCAGSALQRGRASVSAVARALPLRCTLSLLLFSLLLPRLVRADEALAIPESCGTQAELAREASAMRGATTGALPATRMRREGELYVLEVDLPEGRRTLRDGDCRALFRAAILISALGEGALAEPREEPERPRPALLTSAPPPPAQETARQLRAREDEADPLGAPARPRARATRGSPLLLAALLRVAGVYGVVPGAGAELALGAELARSRFRARLALSVLTPGTSAREQGIAVRVYGVGAQLAVGARITPWLELACGAELAALHGRALGALRDRPSWAALPLLHAELSLRLLERGRLRLDLPLAALFAPARSRFLVEGVGAVYTSESVGFRAGLRASLPIL